MSIANLTIIDQRTNRIVNKIPLYQTNPEYVDRIKQSLYRNLNWNYYIDDSEAKKSWIEYCQHRRHKYIMSDIEKKITMEELKERQAMCLRDKMDLSAERIEKWYDYWKGNIYVAFSGGKDSTVLLHLARSIFPEIPAVFSDTGLEFPEIKEFIKTIDNVITVRPKLSFRQVIEKYGYPIISKEQSRYIFDLRKSKSEKLINIRINGNKWGMGKVSKKWMFLKDAPFDISDKCCTYLKKNPSKKYEQETGRKVMIGSTVSESFMRRETYLRFGCNAYDLKHPMSMPLAFWSENDIWEYINKFNIPYSKIYDMGYDRTGCMFCMYGIHKEPCPNKFQKMKETHPKLYEYCINSLGLGAVLDFIDVEYE
jgi:3'-phosphoadenosine 5'-phosphosulfate sulfotransferase (PAPS reductase)/FAD synthetase